MGTWKKKTNTLSITVEDVADDGNNRVRKVTPQGDVTTVAGSATEGQSIDGGYNPLYSKFSWINALARDAYNNIYISDSLSPGLISVLGVENMVKHYVPEVQTISAEDDPNSTVDPYYAYGPDMMYDGMDYYDRGAHKEQSNNNTDKD